MFYFYYRDPSASSLFIAITAALGASIYECIQPFFKLGYFDWLDIIASCLAGLLFRFIVYIIAKTGVTD
jgi:glycopeptide antibiotics resistance protein